MDAFVTYAQNFEDVMLWRALKHVERGFYIDAGANDPVLDSVTKAFYLRGWRGINVEPAKHLHQRLVADRPRDINLCVALSSRSGEVDFFEIGESGLSTIDAEVARRHAESGRDVRRYRVHSLTLREVCELHRVTEVQFLKIDVEGAEEDVLRGMDFDRVRPWIVLIEATQPNTQIPSFEAWEPLLLNAGYLFVYSDGTNRYYVSKEHAELRDAFRAPPNMFDDFIHYRYHERIEAQRRQLEDLLGSRSWRITAPVRSLSTTLRALLHGRKKS